MQRMQKVLQQRILTGTLVDTECSIAELSIRVWYNFILNFTVDGLRRTLHCTVAGIIKYSTRLQSINQSINQSIIYCYPQLRHYFKERKGAAAMKLNKRCNVLSKLPGEREKMQIQMFNLFD